MSLAISCAAAAAYLNPSFAYTTPTTYTNPILTHVSFRFRPTPTTRARVYKNDGLFSYRIHPPLALPHRRHPSARPHHCINNTKHRGFLCDAMRCAVVVVAGIIKNKTNKKWLLILLSNCACLMFFFSAFFFCSACVCVVLSRGTMHSHTHTAKANRAWLTNEI